MFFFFQLFAGIVFGLLIADLLHDRRWAIPFVISAVLPNLIDTPIGYVFFADVFGNGRIFLHSLLVFSVILIIGIVIWKHWTNPAGIVLALGTLPHQVFDIIWEALKTRVLSVARAIRLQSRRRRCLCPPEMGYRFQVWIFGFGDRGGDRDDHKICLLDH
ncbi:MAG: hypothetical protein NTV68_00305 [Methanomicrobiales archaeon]|nr:hypothetical protein [Methanomicrobiales archaeon]